ncbi:MAG: methylmalonyl-CoA mutase family protein, partial [Bacteroidota bacterium]
METIAPYKPKHKVRIVTAASLFDGHDAAINLMRRIIQSTGCEVIHLGHDRSVEEVVNTAIQEDAQAIAMTSYQGGHMEYFKYMFDLLKEKGAGHIKIFGGGGGTILPEEIAELHKYGISRVYHPDDGRKMGLQGMINDMVEKSDFPTGQNLNGEVKAFKSKDKLSIARLISAAENYPESFKEELQRIRDIAKDANIPILGITGTGGAGKSSLVDELIRRFLIDFDDKTLAIVSVDPSKRKTGGALLGDRIRMNSVNSDRVYMRSLATRQSNLALSKHVADALSILKAAEFDMIILETSGIGQSDTEILDHSDVSLYVMTPEYGAATQLEKIDMLDFADLIAINKFDKRGALDALRDVKKQYKRNHQLWDAKDDELPVHGTIASQFNDPGMNALYRSLMMKVKEETKADLETNFGVSSEMSEKIYIIPPNRTRYLSEISENNRAYDTRSAQQSETADKLYSLAQSLLLMGGPDKLKRESVSKDADELVKQLDERFETIKKDLDPHNWDTIIGWQELKDSYKAEEFIFKVRDKEIRVPTHTKSLSHSDIPKVVTPKYRSWGDILRWTLQENVPGSFPYTAGIYPFKRVGEDPTRMFAGEGGPERTNRRFHYVSVGMPAARLSTAFDSVTLYGNDPDHRPDIYGKIGNSGVSICCLDDAKKLYSGFNLCDPTTSVSMTINGPAPMLLGFFMNAAIDQQCEIYIKENGLEKEVAKKIEAKYKKLGVPQPEYRGDLPETNDGLGLMLLGVTGDEVLPADVYADIKAKTLAVVRGTVQADILKEDQAQNTCIFSTEFALRLMGDVQQYFIDQKIRNFYSVSISGYHIAEAGANPITQLAFTLANGFTYVEYYLSRGMDINAFGPNLSFFFSNGIDPEYAVIGRVARRIWSKALKEKYGANPRAQMLKYHIQTSGRSLHAQEIDFNDIRTTLQ